MTRRPPPLTVPESSPGKPVDPTRDATDQMGDTYGRTGVTVDDKRTGTVSYQDENAATEAAHMSRGVARGSEEKFSTHDTPNNPKRPSSGEPHDADIDDDADLDPRTPPDSRGEVSVSGSATAPGADDDTLQNAHAVGLDLASTDEHPAELGDAGDVQAAENDR